MEDSWRERYEDATAELTELYAHQVELTLANEDLRRRLRLYEGSRSVKLATQLSAAARWALPAGSKRRRIVGFMARSILRRPSAEQRANEAYRAWLAVRTPSADDLARQRASSESWAYRPMVSICMPVFNPSPAALSAAVASVQRQSYENWELCICDDGSSRQGLRELLEARSQHDARIKVVFSDSNRGISSATNEALALATGDYVGFLDDDDLIEPQTLFLYVSELQADPSIDILYCDEDMVLPSGERLLPFVKPGWSPETLLSMNYVTHFVVARRQLVSDVEGMRPECDGAQDHDLMLRLSECAPSVRHIPEVLYSWRQSPTSTSVTAAAKPWAYEAGIGAVRDALARRGIDGTVEPGEFAGAYRVRYSIPQPPPHVTILIPTRDRVDLLRPCIESIVALTAHKNYSITILDNGSVEDVTHEFFRESGMEIIDAAGPFNYSAIMNRGFAESTSEFILTLNNDTRVLDAHWVGGLLELCSQPGVGAVGCRLVFNDGRLQHEGIVIGLGGPAANLCFEAPGIRVIGVISAIRDVTAVTGACSLIRRSAWEEVGGFDEQLGVAYNDVDFCMKLRQAGHRVLYTPYVTLVHEESSSRAGLHPPGDEALLLRRWARQIAEGDPFFSPLLTVGRYGLELSGGDAVFRGSELVRLSTGRLSAKDRS